ncbi:phosphatase PAP2 family protein [Sphingomonas sp.]|uniref:phosphatase PAP2 family protein n=1 Tax=Sphingomonas sp. TaxID=28214 RepID=UPI003CC65CA1
MSTKPTKSRSSKPKAAKSKETGKRATKTATKAKKAANRVARADVQVTHQAARFRDSPVMKALATLLEGADQPPLIAASAGTLAIGLLARRGDLARGGARMLASHLLATGAKLAIKHQFDRTRPSEALAHGHRFARGDEGGHAEKSFPSGHTAGAVAVARAASHEIDGAAVPAALAAAGVAAGQAPAGNHYLTDVVAGAAIGWAAEAVVGAVFDRFEQHHPLPPAGEGQTSNASG